MEATMGLNIKNERVEKLARRLAQTTGETMTGAIERALEERLERVCGNDTPEERLRRIREITSKLPPPPPGVTSDHSDLYDENGLPV
jgi:antitoxin VapB